MKNEMIQTDSVKGISMIHEDTKRNDKNYESSNYDSDNYYSFNKTIMLSQKNNKGNQSIKIPQLGDQNFEESGTKNRKNG